MGVKGVSIATMLTTTLFTRRLNDMLKLIDRLSDAFGWLAAAAFVAVGAMITYEVVMRYVFLAM